MLGIRPVEQEKPYSPAEGLDEIITAFRDGLHITQGAKAKRLKAWLESGGDLKLDRIDLFNLLTIVEYEADLAMRMDRIKKEVK